MVHESTKHLHNLARGTFELCKKIGYIAFVLEILLIIAASAQTFINVKFLDWLWVAFIAMFLAIFGLLLRILQRHCRATADSMRRTSVRFYANDNQVPQTTLTNFLSGLLGGYVERIAQKLPAGNMDAYYGTTLPPGIGRHREITACNSFFTWNIQKTYSWILGIISGILLLVFIYTLYGIATSEISLSQRILIAKSMYTIIIGIFLFRSANEFVVTLFSNSTLKTLANEIMKPNLSDDEIMHLIIEYECERASGSLVPTIIYLRCRKKLNTLWDLRRKDLQKIYELEEA